MSDLMVRLAELTRDLFTVGSEEDGRTVAEADVRIRELEAEVVRLRKEQGKQVKAARNARQAARDIQAELDKCRRAAQEKNR